MFISWNITYLLIKLSLSQSASPLVCVVHVLHNVERKDAFSWNPKFAAALSEPVLVNDRSNAYIQDGFNGNGHSGITYHLVIQNFLN